VAISAAPAPENTEAVITRLEHEWESAIVKKDMAAINRLLHLL
jgi:hypothetical protein